MAPDPSQEAISQVTEFSGCDPDTARRYLKVKNNDVVAAISSFLESEDISGAENAMAWSEGDFAADRDGTVPFGPSQAPYDNDSRFIHPLGAPTRGPTPVSSLKRPETTDEEDAEVRRAIAMSYEDAGLDQQETGVVSAKGVTSHFGPATRPSYNPNEWGMVTSGRRTTSGQEIVPDLEPTDRVNVHGEPRFIRPLPSREYLPNLLTILHAIPLSRKALLMPDKTRMSYGHDSEWWKGHAIKLPRIVSTADLPSVEPADTQDDELLAEMQRLMAFLDMGSRSYASADSLLSLDAVQEIPSVAPLNSAIDRVLHAWELSVEKTAPGHASDAHIFRSKIGTTDSEGLSTPYMRLMPLSIDIHHEDREVTLTEVLNELLWDLDDPEESDNYMEEAAEILPMHVFRQDTNAPRARLVIPPSFHLDQYLKENVGGTRHLRKEIALAKQRVTNIDMVRLKLERFQRGHSGTTIDSSVLLDHSIGHFSGRNKQAMLDERLASGADTYVDLPPPPEHHEQIVRRLNAIYDSLKSKIDILNQENTRAKELLAKLWQSTSEIIPPDLLKHRYSLRGVATKPNITYVLRPCDDTKHDAMMDDDEAPEGMRWWRIEYDEDGTKVSKTLSTQDDVIRAAELEYKEALIVYASDAAIVPQQNDDVPEPLREFIRHDDEAFTTELQFAGTVGHGNVNVSPLERERRLSVDSTTVNFGDDVDPPSYEQPTHEIMLEGIEPEDGTEVEMIEKPNTSFLDQLGSTQRKSSDATMLDAEQSSSHVEVSPGDVSQNSMDLK